MDQGRQKVLATVFGCASRWHVRCSGLCLGCSWLSVIAIRCLSLRAPRWRGLSIVMIATLFRDSRKFWRKRHERLWCACMFVTVLDCSIFLRIALLDFCLECVFFAVVVSLYTISVTVELGIALVWFVEPSDCQCVPQSAQLTACATTTTFVKKWLKIVSSRVYLSPSSLLCRVVSTIVFPRTMCFFRRAVFGVRLFVCGLPFWSVRDSMCGVLASGTAREDWPSHVCHHVKAIRVYVGKRSLMMKHEKWRFHNWTDDVVVMELEDANRLHDLHIFFLIECFWFSAFGK